MNSAAASPVPFPSPAAADPITRLQLLLTNYSNHLYEVVQQVPEAALPLPLPPATAGAADSAAAALGQAGGDAASPTAEENEEEIKAGKKGEEEKKQQQQRFQTWLMQAAENLASIMQAVETEAEKLPSSNRKIADIYAKVAELEQQNSAAAEELAAAAAAASRLHRLLRMQTRAALAAEGLEGCIAVEEETDD